MRGPAVVVAKQISGLIGEWSDQGDLDAALLQRQRAVVLQQHHRFVGQLCAPVRDARDCSSSFSSIFEYGTISGGSNMPSLMRAVNSRISAVSISLSFRNALLVGVEVGLVVVIVVNIRVVQALVVHAALDRQARRLRAASW